MFGSLGFQELLILIFAIAVLSITGLWPAIVRGLRELRGESTETPPAPGDDLEVCYKLLGLSPSASWPEVERAYREKAKVHHPDRGGDDDAMRALNDAYARLKAIRSK